MSRDGIIDGMARGLWVSAYADWVEGMSKAQRKAHGDVPVNISGINWDDAAPDTPEAAENAARELAELYETENGVSLDVLERRASEAEGEDVDPDDFGRYLAYEAMGMGIAWDDDHESFEHAHPSFSCHFDGEYFDWSGKTWRANPTPPAKGWGTGEKRWRVWIGHAPDNYVHVTAGGYMEAMRKAAPQWKNLHNNEVVELIAKADGGRAIEALVTVHAGGRLTFHPPTQRGNPAGLTKKGERMYKHVKKAYEQVGDIRAKEIAARTVLARAKHTPGLRKKPRRR